MYICCDIDISASMLLKENSHRYEKINTDKCQYYVYYFYCSECKKEIKSQYSQLKRHSGKCQRCCQLKEPYKFIYNELQSHRNKKVTFDLTFDEFKEIITIEECHYCGQKLEYNEYSRDWGKGLSRAHQLDRKNNKEGYIKDNVVPCCWNCNRLKSDIYSYEEFMLLSPILRQIHKNRDGKNCEIV